MTSRPNGTRETAPTLGRGAAGLEEEHSVRFTLRFLLKKAERVVTSESNDCREIGESTPRRGSTPSVTEVTSGGAQQQEGAG